MISSELSIVAFRAEAGNEMSRLIAARMNDSRELHVSSTTIGQDFIVRLAFLSQRTTKEVAERAVATVRSTLDGD